MTGETLVYVYGITEPPQPLDVLGTGIDPDSEVRMVVDGNLLAIVSDVPAREFSTEPLKEHLNEMEWLRLKVPVHQRVLADALEGSPVVPMRFCTIYESDEHVRLLMRQHEQVLKAALSDIREKREWGVKLFFDREEVSDWVVREDSEIEAKKRATEAGSEGRRYLMNKQLDRLIEEASQSAVSSVARDVHDRLSMVSEASHVGRPQNKDLSGDARDMALNGAYFVHTDRKSEFRAIVEELGRTYSGQGFGLQMTGPWPPYNFVTIDLGQEPE
jgi:Gas vesicle synthesis protein GvpL/GvpF